MSASDHMSIRALVCITILWASGCLCGCTAINNTPIGKGVKTYEKYSDELGRERDVKVLGKDVVIEPEADEKIRISF